MPHPVDHPTPKISRNNAANSGEEFAQRRVMSHDRPSLWRQATSTVGLAEQSAPSTDDIAARAYIKHLEYQARHQDQNPVQNWLEAERELRSESIDGNRT